VPLLARTVTAPLAIDVRRGALAALGPLLADRRISAGGDVAVVVGPGQGERIAPHTRPDRYTIIEHLDLGPDEIRRRLAGYFDALRDPLS
jgi:hypothetical protein